MSCVTMMKSIKFVRACHLFDELGDALGGHEVEARKRLIHQEQMFAAHELLRDGDALALAARQFWIGYLLACSLKSNLLSRSSARAAMSPARSRMATSDDEVAAHRAMGKERIVLGDNPHHCRVALSC